MKKFFLTGVAVLALSGCDMIAGLVGADEYNKNGSTTNRSRGAGDDGVISNLQPVGPAPTDQTGADQTPPDGQTQDQPGQQTPPDGQTGAPDGATGGVDSSMLIGRWGDNGNCSQAIEFFANGSFQAGAVRGGWRLTGDRLTLSANGRNVSWRIQSITAQRIVARDSNGQMTQSVRC